MNDDDLNTLSDQQLLQMIDNARTVLETRVASKRVDPRMVEDLLGLVSRIETAIRRVDQDLSTINQDLSSLRARVNDLSSDTGGGDTGGGGVPTPVELAFPGAAGFGAQSRGGRGGRVIEVSNLNDSGPGSFRDAVTQTGPRILVFKVGGTITLNSRLVISGAARSFLTIAGQSAPGKGIQFKGHGILFAGGVHDVVVRNIRVRMGGMSTTDTSSASMAVYGSNQTNKVYNFIFDHCSFYWGFDETCQCWDYAENVTWQWCIFEGANHLFPNSTSLNVAKALLLGAETANAAYIRNITIHHCFMVNTAQRNPALTGDGPFHMVNNVIYNWQDFGTQIQNRGAGVRLNLIGNYYKRGPASNPRRYAVGVEGPNQQPDGMIYVKDNIGPFRAFNNLDDWDIMGYGFANGPNGFLSLPAPKSLQRAAPWPAATAQLVVSPVERVVDEVLETVGALPRDEVDERAVNDYRRGVGSVKTTSQLRPSDWAQLPEAVDSQWDHDRDGIPTLWEAAEAQKGADLDYNDPSDRNELAPSGYTWIEEYLNQLMSGRGA